MSTAQAQLAREKYWLGVQKNERLFIENTYSIRTKKATFDKLILNTSQAYVDRLQTESIEKGLTIRDLILKYRQWGCSTWALAKGATKTVSRRNWRTLVTAHHKERAKALFRQFRTFLSQIPKELQPTYSSDNEKEIFLTDRNSSATISTAKTPEFVRGDMFNWWHMTEIDYYLGEGGSLFTQLVAGLPMIPKFAGMGVTAESTANGADGEMYQLWMQIIEGKNEYGFRPIFVNWKYDRLCEYSLHHHEGDEQKPWEQVKAERDSCSTCHYHRKTWAKAHADEELLERRRKYGLTWEQIIWYHRTCFTDCRGDWRKMAQEYPCDWEEAFIASGTPVWSMKLLEKIRLRTYQGKLFECPAEDFNHWSELSESTILRPGEDPYFMMWKQPRPNHRYMIGADSSLGTETSNPCAATVVDMETLQVVALLHGRIDPKTYAQYLARIGKYYNMAMIAPEQQNTGYAVISVLEDIYPNVYQKYNLKPGGWVPLQTLGFSTDRATRPFMVQQARQLLNAFQNDLDALAELIPSSALVREMMGFTHGKMQKGKAQAGAGMGDDIVMSWLIAITATHQELGIGLNQDALQHFQEVQVAEQKRIRTAVDMDDYMAEMERFTSGDHERWG